jgi:hypothetical protein
VDLAYVASQVNITATITWFAITTGATAGLSYYKKDNSQKKYLKVPYHF